MSRTYAPLPSKNSTGVVFSDNEFDEGEDALRLRRKVNYLSARTFSERIRDDWNARRPYYIIMITVGVIIVSAIGLTIYISKQ